MEGSVLAPIATVIVALIAAAGAIIVARINKKVEQQAAMIADLYVRSMSDDTFNQLKKFENGSYGPFWLDPNDRSWGLSADLNYLLMLGYIEFKPGCKAGDIRGLPRGKNVNGQSGDQLSDYLRITDRGHSFIRLREQARLTQPFR